MRFSLLLLFACSPKTITLLHTTDIHANVAAWDYLQAQPDPQRGLAKAASIIRQRRTPCSLVIDTGDAIQGAPLGPAPMAAAMNAVGYDVMALGNHDYNFGLPTLKTFISEAKFAVLAGNVSTFNAFVIKDVCGVKVGVLGLVTPRVDVWEKPEHIEGLKFYSALETAKAQVPQLKRLGADIVVVAIHAGPLGDGLPGENEAGEIAKLVPNVDVILSGHTHSKIPKLVVNGVLISQPHRWASHVGETTIVYRGGVQAKDSQLLPVDEAVEDTQVLRTIERQHRATLALMEAPIGQTLGAFEGGDQARFAESALADLINEVQTQAAATAGFQVDASATTIFSDKGHLPKGAVSLRDVHSVYIYDNTLWVLQMPRQTLLDALEHNAAYFGSGRDVGDWDIYSGVTYTIDATKPVGQRVTLTAPNVVNVALNNYRANGGGGYEMFKGAKVLWRSHGTVREMLIAYIKANSPIAPKVTPNFTLIQQKAAPRPR